MDIVEISAVTGEQVEFMDLVEEPYKKRCARYVEKCKGPTYIYKETQGKTPMQYASEAFLPLEKYKQNIGMIIDSSTTKGFCEPSQACLYAQHLGINYSECFDIAEACNGFARSLKLAYQTFQTDDKFKDKYILVINNEQPPKTRPVLPESPDDKTGVASYYVGLTFSNVCTFTLLQKSENHSWGLYFDADSKYSSHICIPLPELGQGFLPKCDIYKVDLNNQYGQFCLPSLHKLDEKVAGVLAYTEKQRNFFEEANVICHTFSKSSWEELFQFTNFGQLTLTYNETGNLGSASLPFILHQQYGPKLQKGIKIAFMGVAAGGSGCVINFTQGDVCEKQSSQLGGRLQIYSLVLKMGLRHLKEKIFCQKRKNKVVEGQKQTSESKKQK